MRRRWPWSKGMICDLANGAVSRTAIVSCLPDQPVLLQNMAQRKDIETTTPEQPASQEPVGRVEFDSRGNSVWRWARDVLDSTSILLKRLENADLAIEPTQKVPVLGSKKLSKPGNTSDPTKSAKSKRGTPLSLADEDEGGRDQGGGFNPYNSR